MTKYFHNDVEWAKDLEHRFGEYMSLCYEYADEDTDEETFLTEPAFTTVSGQPFCTCDTCDRRETIMFLIPEIIEAYKAGIIVEE